VENGDLNTSDGGLALPADAIPLLFHWVLFSDVGRNWSRKARRRQDHRVKAISP